MSEDVNQNNNEFSTVGYDICAAIFALYPLISLFRINYSDAGDMLHSALTMILFALFPLAITKISLSKENTSNKSVCGVTFTFLLILLLVYFIIFIIGLADGGRLF